MADLEANQQREMEVEQVELTLMENAHLFMPQQPESLSNKHAVARMVKELTGGAETSVAQHMADSVRVEFDQKLLELEKEAATKAECWTNNHRARKKRSRADRSNSCR